MVTFLGTLRSVRHETRHFYEFLTLPRCLLYYVARRLYYIGAPFLDEAFRHNHLFEFNDFAGSTRRSMIGLFPIVGGPDTKPRQENYFFLSLY